MIFLVVFVNIATNKTHLWKKGSLETGGVVVKGRKKVITASVFAPRV